MLKDTKNRSQKIYGIVDGVAGDFNRTNYIPIPTNNYTSNITQHFNGVSNHVNKSFNEYTKHAR